jgi:tetratricopeptide (TPR) repeat protein
MTTLARQATQDPHVFEREFSNIWGAVQECYERKDWQLLIGFREALQSLLDNRGAWEQCLILLEWVREAAVEINNTQIAARCLHDQGDMLNQQGRYHEAEQQYLTAEQTYQQSGDNESAIKSRHMRSLVVRAQGRLDEAERLNHAVLAEVTTLELGHWRAHPLYVRGLLARDHNDYAAARQAVVTGLTLLEATDETAMIAQCHHFLGEVALLEGHLADAREELEQSLRLSQKVGIRRRIAATQRLLGDLALLEGRDTDAEHIYQAAMDTAGALGDQSQLARLLLALSYVFARRENVAQIGEVLRSAHAIYEQIGDQRGVTITAALLARHELRQRHIAKALRLLLHALETAWQAKLLRPRLLIGMWRRRRGL